MVASENRFRPDIEFVDFAEWAAPVGLAGMLEECLAGVVADGRVWESAVDLVIILGERLRVLAGCGETVAEGYGLPLAACGALVVGRAVEVEVVGRRVEVAARVAVKLGAVGGVERGMARPGVVAPVPEPSLGLECEQVEGVRLSACLDASPAAAVDALRLAIGVETVAGLEIHVALLVALAGFLVIGVAFAAIDRECYLVDL